MRPINHIVLHCTATLQTAKVESILKYWREVCGWKNPGYHHIILPDGTVRDLLPIEQESNGVRGHNDDSIHISYIGGVDASLRPLDNRTPEQQASMEALVRKYKKQFPRARVLGHCDFPGVKKACPAFNVASWLHSIGL